MPQCVVQSRFAGGRCVNEEIEVFHKRTGRFDQGCTSDVTFGEVVFVRYWWENVDSRAFTGICSCWRIQIFSVLALQKEIPTVPFSIQLIDFPEWATNA